MLRFSNVVPFKVFFVLDIYKFLLPLHNGGGSRGERRRRGLHLEVLGTKHRHTRGPRDWLVVLRAGALLVPGAGTRGGARRRARGIPSVGARGDGASRHQRRGRRRRQRRRGGRTAAGEHSRSRRLGLPRRDSLIDEYAPPPRPPPLASRRWTALSS